MASRLCPSGVAPQNASVHVFPVPTPVLSSCTLSWKCTRLLLCTNRLSLMHNTHTPHYADSYASWLAYEYVLAPHPVDIFAVDIFAPDRFALRLCVTAARIAFEFQSVSPAPFQLLTLSTLRGCSMYFYDSRALFSHDQQHAYGAFHVYTRQRRPQTSLESPTAIYSTLPAAIIPGVVKSYSDALNINICIVSAEQPVVAAGKPEGEKALKA
ncbi:hypothetical protein C8R44DRAFT_886734 [Mycena epipterygia]|nr:hypothetical protein C8R44DRAFT_886734 [Mycena epipterygia]